MSIVTRTGDQGTTGLMYNRRVAKNHPRVDAYGTVDELNAAIGMARAQVSDGWLPPHLKAIQQDLVLLMGELATAPVDRERYVRDGFQLVTPALTVRLDGLVAELESQKISFQGWATPGGTPLSAALDLARTTCRRAERRVYALTEVGEPPNPEILIYLNRLSDLLWLMARWVETQAGVHPAPSTSPTSPA